jgi:hypothetical protein
MLARDFFHRDVVVPHRMRRYATDTRTSRSDSCRNGVAGRTRRTGQVTNSHHSLHHRRRALWRVRQRNAARKSSPVDDGGIDVGASTRILRGKGWTPEITGGIRAYGFVQLSDQPKPRLYPSISANASWTIRERDLIYAGSHLTAQFSPNETFVSPFIGYSVAASDNLSLQLECIWQASNHDTRSGVLEGISSIGGQGSFGIFIAGVIRL